ncbi:MAG: transcriptional regulator GlxA family with amidase domain [Planctomycetota bacterium]|jgi:transcriptional regulator GlxA family with amidase domain
MTAQLLCECTCRGTGSCLAEGLTHCPNGARRLVTAPMRGGDQPQRSSESLVPAGNDKQLFDFLLHLKADLARQYTAEAAARELGMSQRTFHRKFNVHTGESYGQ